MRGEFGVDPAALSALWVVADLAEGAGADEMQEGTERYRIEGGTIRLVRALQQSIGADRITLSTRITHPRVPPSASTRPVTSTTGHRANTPPHFR